MAASSTDSARPDAHLQQMITQVWGSVQVIKKQDAVAVGPRPHEINHPLMNEQMWVVATAPATVV